MKKEFVRNPYNYDSDEVSDATGLACPEETLTQQQFVEEADINYIAHRFLKTGELPQVLNMPTSGDFEGIFDFQTAMNTIVQAKQEFMKLPAKVRSRFENDPQQILEFLEDPENKDEAIRLGLIEKPATITTPPNLKETNSGPDRTSSTQGKEKTGQGTAGTAPTQGDSKPPQKP